MLRSPDSKKHFVDEVFISNVGGDSAAVKLLLGSDEVTIPVGAFTDFEPIEVDGDELAGYDVRAFVCYNSFNSYGWLDTVSNESPLFTSLIRF